MEFLANRKDLLPLLKKLRTVVPRTFENAATDCILMEADEQTKTVIFTAVNWDCSLQLRLNHDCSVVKGGAALVFAAALEGAISLFGDEATTIMADDKKVLLRNKTTEYEFANMDTAKFPKPHEPDMPDALFDCTDLPQVVSQILFSTSASEDKPALQCIHMFMQDGIFTAEACDGNRMTMLKREGSPQGGFEMLISGATMRLLEAILKDQKLCKVGLYKNTALFLGHNMIFAAKTMADTHFVDLQKLINSHSAASSLRIDGSVLLLALKQIGVGPTKNARVLIRPERDGISLQLLIEEKYNEQQIFAETSIPAEHEAPLPKEGFCYNYGYLRDALKTMTTEQLLLQFDRNGSLAIQLKNRVHLLMPLRMPKTLPKPQKPRATRKKKNAA